MDGEHFADKIIITAAGRQDTDAAAGQPVNGNDVRPGSQIVIQLLYHAAADDAGGHPLPISGHERRQPHFTNVNASGIDGPGQFRSAV